VEPPISYDDLKDLFEHLNRPDVPDCDNTLRESFEFLRDRGLPIESTMEWLNSNGAFCDCEVIYNVTNDWGDKVGWDPQYDE
jgi:hypothetical protein